MPYELKVCLRYLRPRKSRAYISVNTLISIFGIAIGVMTLIVVIGVMTGFGNGLKEKFVGLFSHIEVSCEDVISEYKEPLRIIKDTADVVAVSPFVEGNLSLRIDNRAFTLFLPDTSPRHTACLTSSIGIKSK